jgi:hypothetical protein
MSVEGQNDRLMAGLLASLWPVLMRVLQGLITLFAVSLRSALSSASICRSGSSFSPGSGGFCTATGALRSPPASLLPMRWALALPIRPPSALWRCSSCCRSRWSSA